MKTQEKAELKNGYHLLYAEFEDLGGTLHNFSFPFRMPTAQEIAVGQASIGKNALSGSATFCQAVVDPDRKDELVGVFREFPGVADTYATAIFTSCGFNSRKK